MVTGWGWVSQSTPFGLVKSVYKLSFRLMYLPVSYTTQAIPQSRVLHVRIVGDIEAEIVRYLRSNDRLRVIL